MNLFLNFILGGFLELIVLFLYAFLHKVEREHIIELGYKTIDKKYRPSQESSHWIDSLFFWSLCKNAKLKARAIWFYFAMNIFICLFSIISLSLCIYLVIFQTPKTVFLYLAAYLVSTLYLWGLPHFVLDLFFLPSVKTRYNIKGKRRN